MAEMSGFGKMDVTDRGGDHDFHYKDVADKPARFGITPSQTIGPFFAFGLTPGPYGYHYDEIHHTNLAFPGVSGERITIIGQVFDCNGEAIHDAMIEFLQADNDGEYVEQARNDGFTGYGRVGTGASEKLDEVDGPGYKFKTIKPGNTTNGSASFLTLIVTMRGLLNHCITRMYFPEDNLETDAILNQIPEKRRSTLVAKKIDPSLYRFDLHMQGPSETVFFDL